MCIGLALVGLLVVTSPNATAQAPIVVTPPVITDQPLIGQILTPATEGGWNPAVPATLTYQWLRCSRTGQECVAIDNAIGFTYPVSGEDFDHSLRIQLTVSGVLGGVAFSESDQSNATETVPALPPSNSQLPGVTGEAREGLVLTASPGVWNGVPPPSFVYQWQRCDAAGLNCNAIAGAVNATYTLSAADVAMTVRVVVTASNLGGSASAVSEPTPLVRRAPLISDAPPVIIGAAEVERSLVATPGQWLTSGPIDFLYRWLRCNASGSGCDPIAGATGPTYQVRMSDIGFTLRARVTAINDAGSMTRDSEPSALVPAPPGVQTFSQSGTTPVFAPSAALMRPFPRVRIKGYVTSTGAVLQLVTVRGPARTRIALACRGRTCPFHRRTRRGGPRVRLRSLERSFVAGTRLTIRVTKPALIGKYTRIVIRAKQVPFRRDRCLLPGSPRPVPCPTDS
jgi:hypothetical protein